MLALLPTEVLSSLTSFLDGHEIDLLWACGSFYLNQKLYQPGAAPSYKVEWDGIHDLKVSSFVKRHLNLRTFEWRASRFAVNSSLGSGRYWMQDLPKSLLTLRLEGRDVFKAFTGVNTSGMESRSNILAKHHSIALNDLFPLLKNLYITSTIGFTSTFLHTLPPNLEIMHLDGLKAVLHENTLPRFPSSLKTFETTCVFIFSGMDGTRVFPDTLESLGCSSTLDSQFFELLPSSLKSLRIMHVQSRTRDSEILNWSRMPVGLERLLINRKYFTPEEMGQLPRSLRYLMIDTSILLDDSFVPYLPPSLTKICMGYSVGIEKEWSKLPSSLVWFGDGPIVNLPTFCLEPTPLHPSSVSESPINAIHRSNLDLSQLPRDLARVDLSGALLTPEELASLPRSVTRLKLEHLDDELARNLPPKLTYLSLSDDTCSAIGTALLPRSIHTLLFNKRALLDPHSIQKLPEVRFLSFLRLEPVSWDVSLFKDLPLSLESLKIHDCREFMADGLVEALTKHNRLETLEISADRHASQISYLSLQHLPNSLISLDICLKDENIPPTAIEHIPRRVRSLRLQSPAYVDWCNQDLQHLPPWLAILEIPPTIRTIDKPALQYLPKTLDIFSIGQSTPIWWSMRTSS